MATRRRRSPTPYMRRGTALTWFAVCLMALVALGALFYQFVIDFDFESFTEGTGARQAFLPEEGYTKVSYPPQPYAAGETPQPTPMPTPRPTPVPIDKYAMLNKRMMIPTGYEVVYAGLTECRASLPDNDRALVLRGWGYLEELDATKSNIYVVVSTKYGDTHRFYLAKKESGSTGLIHDPATGTNLDQADFSCNIRIEDTYQDGEYRLGVVVSNRDGRDTTSGYTRIGPDYNFSVTNGRITAFEGGQKLN